VTQEGFGRCGLVPIDSTPLGNVVSRSSPIVGELRVHAQLRADTRQPFIVTIVSSDSGGPTFTATSDTIATFHELLPGRYKVRVSSVGYSPRSFSLLVAPTAGGSLWSRCTPTGAPLFARTVFARSAARGGECG